jgi:hypothetical protein
MMIASAPQGAASGAPDIAGAEVSKHGLSRAACAQENRRPHGVRCPCAEQPAGESGGAEIQETKPRTGSGDALLPTLKFAASRPVRSFCLAHGDSQRSEPAAVRLGCCANRRWRLLVRDRRFRPARRSGPGGRLDEGESTGPKIKEPRFPRSCAKQCGGKPLCPPRRLQWALIALHAHSRHWLSRRY